MKIDTKLLSSLVETGYITKRKHPFLDLYILNYTRKATRESLWNQYTLMCRGLIINGKDEIIANPFPKFFEGSLNDIPKNALLTEKVDGILCILYWHEERPYIATRGAFDSYQSLIANELLYNKYNQTFQLLNQQHTYLFELVSPHTRVIIDYENKEELFLLAAINNKTKSFVDPIILTDLPFSHPVQLSFDMLATAQDNLIIEGAVASYADNRIKIKTAAYQKAFLRQIEKKETICKQLFDQHFPLVNSFRNRNDWLYSKAYELYNFIFNLVIELHQLPGEARAHKFDHYFSRTTGDFLHQLYTREISSGPQMLFEKMFNTLFITGQYYSEDRNYSRSTFRFFSSEAK
jgi:hypothetical protein